MCDDAHLVLKLKHKYNCQQQLPGTKHDPGRKKEGENNFFYCIFVHKSNIGLLGVAIWQSYYHTAALLS